MIRARSLAALLFLLAGTGTAAESAPITLEVDLRDVRARLVHSHVVIPIAKGGDVALAFPKYMPGEHAPTDAAIDVAGLVLRAGGDVVTWKRDEIDPWTVVAKVPSGARAIDASFDYLAPPSGGGWTAGAAASATLAILSWNHVILAPRSAPIRDQLVAATVRLPEGWTHATALPAGAVTERGVTFPPVSLEMLVDSPLLAGAHMKEIALGEHDGKPHFLSLAADSPQALEMPAETQAAYQRLVVEAGALFGARHYDRYRFLLTLSDHVVHFGLEHHQSSDNRMVEDAVTDGDLRLAWATLLPHEYVHSWNGKYRRPAGMATKDFQEPVRTGLIWVYEGLTNYYGFVLSARSGLMTPEQFRELMAANADLVATQKGRSWRSLDDASVDAWHLYASRDEGAAWRRDTDFYTEGVVLWLEVDTRIREATEGKRSLDDFVRRFHGGASSGPAVKSYVLADIVRELNEVSPQDWAAFFDERVMRVSERPPLGGLERAGWRLGAVAKIPSVVKATEARRKKIMLGSSLGMIVRKDNALVVDVVPGTPAGAVKIPPGAKLVAVNGRRWTAPVFLAAVAATKDGVPLELLYEDDDHFRTVTLDYRGGLRYPALERIEGRPDLLTLIGSPLVPVTPPAPPK